MAFPDRPIRWILPFPPGGSSNEVAEFMRPVMEEMLGRSIEFDIITGGRGGSNGPIAAAAAGPDGYTMLMATIGNMALLPSILSDYEITPLEDLIPVTKVADTPDPLVAHSSLGVSTLDELIAAAKDRPGEITYNPINAASIHRLEFISLMNAAGIDLKEVDVEGGANGAIAAVENGDLDVLFMTAPRTLAPIADGRINGLAVASPRRAGALPDVPTFAELGYPALEIGSWMGLLMPAGSPDEAVSAIFDAATTALSDAGIVKKVAERGLDIDASASPAAFRGFVESETARLAGLASGAGLTGWN